MLPARSVYSSSEQVISPTSHFATHCSFRFSYPAHHPETEGMTSEAPSAPKRVAQNLPGFSPVLSEETQSAVIVSWVNPKGRPQDFC